MLEEIEIERSYWWSKRQEFGEEVLRPRRKQLGLTQQQMAARLGIDQSRISRIERGEQPKDWLIARAIAEKYQLDRRETELWLHLYSGDSTHDLGSLPSNSPPEFIEFSWEKAQPIVQAWLSEDNHNLENLAREACILRPILVDFLQGKTTLDRGSIMKLYDAIHHNMNQVDRRTVIKAFGLTPFLALLGISIPELETASADPLLEAYSHHAETIYKVRTTGNPELTIQIATSMSDQLEKLLKEGFFSRDHPAFLKILAEVLYQQGWAYSETGSKGKIWAHQTGFVDKLHRIAQEHNQEEFAVLGNLFLGDAYYVAGKHYEAARYLRSTLDQITNVEHRLAVLHTLGKIWAYKDEKQQFEEVKLQIVKLLDDGRIENDDLLCWTYASLARAQGYLQLPEAYRSLEEAKKVATRMKTEGQRSLLRMAQIVREEFEVIKQLDPTGHYHYLERQGQEALSMAQVCQCQRLALRLQDLLAQTFS